jgi:uncharacterized membrane protein
MKHLAFLLTALLSASASVALAQAGGTYTTIDFPGATSTVAEGIDSAGDVVGYFVDSGGVFLHGFLLSNGVYTQLDAPGTTNGTIAYGINDVGQVVGTAAGSAFFVYDIPTQSWATYTYPNNNYQTATGINNSGLIVGWASDIPAHGYIGLELMGSTFKQVNVPNVPDTQLTSVNDSGAVVAVASYGVHHPISYLGNGGTFERIVVPGFPNAYAVAINDSNVLAGEYFTKRDSAFEWQRMGLFKPINESKQVNTHANGINSTGQVVGFYNDGSTTQNHGLLWTPPAPQKK